MNTPEYITQFLVAVYPEAPHLAAASFDEEHCLRTATERIRSLTSERNDLLAQRDRALELLREAQGELRWCSGSMDFNPGGLAREGWIRGPQAVLAKIDALLGEKECAHSRQKWRADMRSGACQDCGAILGEKR